MVFLATAATVIASQAVITGAFSVAHQASPARIPAAAAHRPDLGEDDRADLRAVDQLGAMVSVLTLVFAFQTSAALAFAYGMAVTGTITITTLLFFYIARHQWGKPLWLVIAGAARLLAVDLLFLAANLTKLVHGAWLPLLIGVAVFTVLTTWQRGRELVTGDASATRDRCARSSTRCTTCGRRCSGCPAPRCSSTAARTRLRWRCAPTSSTTTSCTSTS